MQTRTTSDPDTAESKTIVGASLAGKAVSAVAWNYMGAVTRIVTQLVAIAVLARILGPRPFGSVAAAWFFITLGTMIAEMGLGSALVQKKSIDEHDVRFVFTVQMILGVALATLATLFAPLMASVFNNDGVTAVLRVLGLVFLFQSFGTCALSILRRNLEFKAIQIVQASSYIVGYALVGISLALAGAGVWSLVGAHIAQSVFHHVGLYALVRHSLRPTLRISSRKALLDYGLTGAAVSSTHWAIHNIDTLAAGAFFGTVPLALYSRVYALLTAPISQIVFIMHSLFLSVVSRVQENTGRQRAFYVASSNVIALLVCPLAFSIAVVPSSVIEGLYGHRWSEAIPIVPALALAMPLYALILPGTSILWGRARLRAELFVDGIALIVLVILLLLVSNGSVVQLAWSVFGAYALRFVLMIRQALRIVEMPPWPLIKSLGAPLVLGIGVALGVKGLDSMLEALHTVATLRLAADAGGGFVFVVAGIALGKGWLFHDETKHVLARVSDVLPGRLGALLGRVVGAS